jgi:zinc D-Ala-D-Ala carboxypeptidase
MQLSKYFTLAELTPSATAKRLGIKNDPTPEHLECLKLLAVNVLDKVREHFGKPIFVSSGYRSKALNDATPGSSATSQHCSGEAADLDQDGRGTGVTNKMVFDYIKDNLVFDQLIYEYGTDANPDWVHVSWESNGKQRKQVLRCTRVNGKPVYTPYK